MEQATVRAARPEDLPRVEALLNASGLPTAGVAQSLDWFLVAEDDKELVGAVGIETCGDYGLLRSAAVAESWRGRGLGKALVERVVREADDRGVRALYLLTTTAEKFFPAFGFAVVGREDVPAPVKATEEFTSACPASATVMARVRGRPEKA